MKGGDPLSRVRTVLPPYFLRDTPAARDRQNFRKK